MAKARFAKRHKVSRRASLAALGIAIACGTTDSGNQQGPRRNPDADKDAATPIDIPRDIPDTSIGDAGNCINLQCKQQECADGKTTSLSGTVYAPNAELPIYNALVYVPNEPLPPIAKELTCDRCGGVPPGRPVVATLTDAAGQFTLTNVPVGRDIPLVMQVGKWRRQIAIPNVKACQETKLDDPEVTRLPRNRTEGDMPRIAVTTGGCDQLVCMFPKLGVDPSEFGIAGEDKAITFYHGSPALMDGVDLARYDAHLAKMTEASTLWGNLEELKKYDMVLLSCECEEKLDTKGSAANAAIAEYLKAGGRVFGTDFQYTWYTDSPDPSLRSAFDVTRGESSGDQRMTVNTSFPKGKALADWLSKLDPEKPYGEIYGAAVFGHFKSVNSDAVQIWASSEAPPPLDEEAGGAGGTAGAGGASASYPRFASVNMPIGKPAEEQCGKAVHLDAHISLMLPLTFVEFPTDCGNGFSSAENSLAFFLFDLSSCIQDESKPPVIPPVK